MLPTIHRCLLIPLALLLVACGGGGSGSGSGDDAGTGDLSDAEIIAAIGTLAAVSQSETWQQDMLDEINQARDDHGDGSDLGWNDELAAAALYYAQDIEDNGAWHHIGTLHDNRLQHRVAAAGYGYAAAGENIASGYASVGSVMAAWMASSGHRASILNAGYTEVGLAWYGGAWVQVFGRPAVTKPAAMSPITQ